LKPTQAVHLVTEVKILLSREW